MAVCKREGCEVEVPAREPHKPGRPRVWCSDNCRKRALDEKTRATCADCGAPLGVGSGWATRARQRCKPCHGKREAAAHRARLEDVAVMYREGLSVREINEQLGQGPRSKPSEIYEAFRLGLLTEADYRYDAVRRENMRAGRQRAA